MKKLIYLPMLLLLTSCATICGGQKYYAKVFVPNCPDASIQYNGTYVGNSSAQFPVKRRDANKVVLTVTHPQYETEEFRFHDRQFRGWAFVGTVLGWTGITQTGLLLPWGIVVDGLTGSWWKPSVYESGISKIDNKHYTYTLNYKKTKVANSPLQETVSGADDNDLSARLSALKDLFESGLITESEYEDTRKTLLNNFTK